MVSGNLARTTISCNPSRHELTDCIRVTGISRKSVTNPTENPRLRFRAAGHLHRFGPWLHAGLGFVVGTSGGQAFFWDGGAMYPLGSLSGGTSAALAINNNDWVVGTSTLTNGSTRAVLWKFNTVTKKATIQDLGTLGGFNSFATGINNQGVVVGYADTGATYEENGIRLGIQRAFSWRNGVMYDLGTHNDFYDFFFVPPYPISRGVAINSVGQIIGNSITINSHTRAFFLTPAYP